MNSVKAEFFPPHKRGRRSLNVTADTDGWIVALGDVGARRRFLSYAGFKRTMNLTLVDLGRESEIDARNDTAASKGEARRHA